MASLDDLMRLGDPDDIRATITRLKSQLAEARAEIERLKVANEGWHQRVGMLKADDEANRARIAELEADVVFAVNHAAAMVRDLDPTMIDWIAEDGGMAGICCDGTPADILWAVREARTK